MGQGQDDSTRTSAACADCFACLPWGRNPFRDAVEQGNHERVAEMISAEITLLRDASVSSRRTAWHIAAEHGHTEVLKALVAAVLGAGAESVRLNSSIRRMFQMAQSGELLVKDFINHRCRGGYTPLALAASRGHAQAIDYLMSVGANPWVVDSNGMCPMHQAAKRNRPASVHELLKHPVEYSRRACRHNTPNTKYVDVLDYWGYTPLHFATIYESVDAVVALLSHDANIIARSTMVNVNFEHWPAGLSPLHIAAWKGNLQIVKLLLRAYYEGSADLLPSQTALMATQERRRRQRSHPDPRLILTRSGRLPYHYAHRNGHTQLLEWLDPSIPLMFLFSGTDEQQPATGGGNSQGAGLVREVGVPRLTVIAANALHTYLLQQLEGAEKEVAEQQRLQEERKAAEAKEAAAAQAKPSNPLAATLQALAPAAIAGTSAGAEVTASAGSSDPGGASAVAAGGNTRDGWLGTMRLGRRSEPKQETPKPRQTKRPRRASQPVGRSPAHSHSPGRDGHPPASLLLRLTQRVGINRRVSASHSSCNQMDMMRMGLTIPANLDREHVAVLARRALGPQDGTTGSSAPLDHMRMVVLSPQARTAQDHGQTLTEGGLLTGGATADIPAEQRAESESQVTGTYFLTAQPPTPRDGHADLEGDAEDSGVRRTWPSGGPRLLPAADAGGLARAGSEGAALGLPSRSEEALITPPLPSPVNVEPVTPQKLRLPGGAGSVPVTPIVTITTAGAMMVDASPVAGASGGAGGPLAAGPSQRSSRPRPRSVQAALEDDSEDALGPLLSATSPRQFLRRSHSTGSMAFSNGAMVVEGADGDGDEDAQAEGEEEGDVLRDLQGPHTPGTGAQLMATIKERLRKMSNQVVPALSPFRNRNRASESGTTPRTAAQGDGGGSAPSSPPISPTKATAGSVRSLTDTVGVDQAPAAQQPPAAAQQAGAAAGGDDADDDTCPVCLDEFPNVRLLKCSHTLCVTCVKDLCKRHRLTPALCPMCRCIISGFAAAPLKD